MAQSVRFQAEIVGMERHTADVVTLQFQADRRLPRFTPGQFVHVTVDDFDPSGFWPESRVFSVANAVADRRSVELTISRQGAYTARIIDSLRLGDSVWCKGPYGKFFLNDSHGYNRAVLIAGGTGITPYAAFMDAALRAQKLPMGEAVLYYGAQTVDLLIYRSLADHCSNDVPGFRVRYFSEALPTSDFQSVSLGRLNIADILAEQQQPEQTAFFLSGPKNMIAAFRDHLRLNDIKPEQILIDAWE